MNCSPVNRDCPVCGSTSYVPSFQKQDLKLVACTRCTMVFANPVPPEFVSGEYYDQAGQTYYLSEEKLKSDYAEVRFERELRLFRRWVPKGTVLDVGCSSGAFLFQLRKRFGTDYQVTGTDVSGPALDYAESKDIPVIRGDFGSHDFGAKRFDAICFWAVLEHLATPAQFLQKADAILASKGYVFVLVPNFRSLATRLLGRRYRYIYAQHLNYFTKETLHQLAGAQFETVFISYTHFNPAVIWQDWRSDGREISNRERAALLMRTTTLKQSRVLGPIKAAYGLTERMLSWLGLADNLVMVLRKRSARPLAE